MIAHGYELGVARHGGYAESARVPADWVVPLPDGLTAREAMAIGTAGFTAAMGSPGSKHEVSGRAHGPVLVTGASGGRGHDRRRRSSRSGLRSLGGRPARPTSASGLPALGAVGFLTRDEVAAPGRPLESAALGGGRRRRRGAHAAVHPADAARGAAPSRRCGNAGGPELQTTVFPFILRGVALLGIDSVAMPIDERRALWDRLGETSGRARSGQA